MVAEDDWRLTFASPYRDASFRWKDYYQWSPTWDHDHCLACWATFSLFDAPDYLKEGYAITAETSFHGEDYNWVCRTCFDELKDNLNWSEVTD